MMPLHVIALGSGTTLLALSALALLVITRRSSRRTLATVSHARPLEVRDLAARGEPRAEIARRTGLAQDAITMLLDAQSADRTRQIRPPAA
jgi:hypothetical protein